MEKAILKTLIYADIFDYPLNFFEIHKWLIGKKATLRQVESAIGRLVKSSKLKVKSEYYFLPKRQELVLKRKRRGKQSKVYLRKAKLIVAILRIIPWIKLVGISGGLSMENAAKSDDIDLFLVVSKNRLWLSRIMTVGLLSVTGQRRTVKDSKRKIAGKLCLNILLEENRLVQSSKDIYLAHEVLQMKVLWQRDGIYGKYLEDNNWAFKFLPNWIGPDTSLRGAKGAHTRRVGTSNLLNKEIATPFGLAMTLENIAKWLQLKMMTKPQGLERIQEGAVYFHPNDCRLQVLSDFQKRVKRLKGL